MHPVLNKYFALDAAIRNVLKPEDKSEEPNCGHSHNNYWCPFCYAQKGWAKELGEVLKAHNIPLEKFVLTASRGAFQVKDGDLTDKEGACVPMYRLLMGAAAHIVD